MKYVGGSQKKIIIIERQKTGRNLKNVKSPLAYHNEI